MENKQQGLEIREKIKHTAKLVPLSQRDLFLYEVEQVFKSLLAEKAEKVRWMHCSEFETKGDLKDAIIKIIED
jgi:hypothetical protein